MRDPNSPEPPGSPADYRLMFELAGVGMAQVDARTRRFLRVNRRLCELTGYAEAELLGLTPFDLTHPDCRAGNQAEWESGLRGESARFALEMRCVRKDGGALWVSVVTTVLRDAEGWPLRTVFSVEDITERRRSRIAKYFLAAVVESSQDSIVTVDAQSTITSWNRSAEHLYGYSAAEAIGQPLTMLALPKDLKLVLGNTEKVMGSKQVVQFETVRVHKDGHEMELEIVLSPVKSESGEVVGVSTIARDITERKRQEANLAFLAEIGANFAPLASPEGVLQMVGERLSAFLGLSRCNFSDVDEGADRITALYDWRRNPDAPSVLGEHKVSSFLSPQARLRYAAGRPGVVQDVYTDPLIAAPPQLMDVLRIRSVVDVPYLEGGRWKFLVSVCRSEPNTWREDEVWLIRELSARIYIRLERARTEAALHESEEKFRTLFESIDEGVVIGVAFRSEDGSVDYRCESVNPAWERIIGLRAGEVVGRSARELMPGLKETWYQAVEHTGLGGESVEVEEFVAPIGKWLAAAFSPIGPGGEGRFAVLLRDVSERKRAEETLRASAEAQRRFAADASHELRAPMGTVLGNLELLERYPQMPEEHRRIAMADARAEAARMARLIADLLALARGDTGLRPRRERVRLDALLAEALRGAALMGYGHRLERNLEPLTVEGDPDRLKELALALLENALKYTPEGGTVRVELRARGGRAELRVEDTGAGIAPEDLPHVFERFYRADKARSRAPRDPGGTGLGLAIARQIVEAHGGEIRLESEPGKGTVAVVRLELAP